MLNFSEIKRRVDYWSNADRLGPDIPWTHWKLYFKSAMQHLCKSKFKHFDEGAEFRPGAYAVSCSKISLGKNVIIRPGTMLFADARDVGGEIVIEDNVLLGSSVHIYVSNHKFEDSTLPISAQGHTEAQSVILKKGCWVGAKAILLPGVTIGENSVVGAGSVVTKSVPARCVVVGNPARIIREM